jgi:hypothetical protein
VWLSVLGIGDRDALGKSRGGRVQACSREFSWCDIAQRRMRTAVFVFFRVFRAEHPGFQQVREVYVEELVAKPCVGAFDEAVLPWRTWSDEEGSGPSCCDPVLHGSDHELKPVVRADEVGNSVFLHQPVEVADDVAAGHGSVHFLRQGFTGELVDHCKALETASTFGPV